MGTTASRPAAAPEDEKAPYAPVAAQPAATAQHHAIDRLARIQAEATMRQTSSSRSASADITPQNVQDWKEDAFAVCLALVSFLSLFPFALVCIHCS